MFVCVYVCMYVCTMLQVSEGKSQLTLEKNVDRISQKSKTKYIILEMKALVLLIKENYKINSILKMLLIKYEKNAKK